jgi:hypothetical protein
MSFMMEHFFLHRDAMVIRLHAQKQFSWQQIVTARMASIARCTIGFRGNFAAVSAQFTGKSEGKRRQKIF